MPVTFIVDPDLPAEVKTITLSYAVYPANENLKNNS
jgi:cytochrome c oxidase assembly protein Cox11